MARGSLLYGSRTRRARLDRGVDAALRRTHTHASAYEALKAQFTEEEQVKLTLMINRHQRMEPHRGRFRQLRGSCVEIKAEAAVAPSAYCFFLGSSAAFT